MAATPHYLHGLCCHRSSKQLRHLPALLLFLSSAHEASAHDRDHDHSHHHSEHEAEEASETRRQLLQDFFGEHSPNVELRWIGAHERQLVDEEADKQKRETSRAKSHSTTSAKKRQLLNRSHISTHPEDLNIEMTIGTKKFDVHLKKNRQLVTANAEHVLDYGNGQVERQPMVKELCYYQGTGVEMDQEKLVATGKKQKSAHLVIGAHSCNPKGLDALVRMKVVENEIENILEESGAQRQLQKELSSSTVIFTLLPDDADTMNNSAALDVGKGAGSTKNYNIEIPEDSPLKHNLRFLSPTDRTSEYHTDVQSYVRQLSVSGTEKYVEVLAVNDKSRYDLFGGTPASTPTMAAHTTAVMNLVNTIYINENSNSNPSAGTFAKNIKIVLIGQHTYVNGDPYEATVTKVGSETDCSDLLSKFNEWTRTNLESGNVVAHDNRVLLSGRDFDGSTVGLAGMGVMCLVSRSGNVNMCAQTESAKADCAAVIAHEVGHNFGMNHDGGGSNSACPQSGFIMEAVGGGDASTRFSDCSANNVNTFFTESYVDNGPCLENQPSYVMGDPVCRNGLVESGEDCDCGASDCSSIDACCNGATCKFAQASYQCSDATGPCCNNCMFRAASENFVCRAKKNDDCDIAETCAGGTKECPKDTYEYPGKACTTTYAQTGVSYSGSCMGGMCGSMNKTCSVDIQNMFAASSGKNWDLSTTCERYNDPCGSLVCHEKGQASTECGQYFSTHGKQMTVPDGTPCWHKSNPWDVRNGMCFQNQCTLPSALAVSPVCGNGGIDYGEECDCGGATTDTCCECPTCKLKSGAQCAGGNSQELCCDSSTCQFKAAGTVCRAAVDSQCDEAETCSGSSGVCPSDKGKQWGTSCTYAADSKSSTCYAKTCVMTKDKQCEAVTAERATQFPLRDSDDTSSSCAALMCCRQYTSGGTLWTSCSKLTTSTSFTVDGVTNTIYLGGPLTGTQLVNGKTNEDSAVTVSGTKLCIRQQYFTPKTASDCATGTYLETSIGDCVNCDSACTACSGPTAFECVGACKGDAPKDTRGACPPFDVSSGTVGGNVTVNQTVLIAQTVTTTTTSGTSASGGTSSSSGTTTTTSPTTSTSTTTFAAGEYRQTLRCVMQVPTGSTSETLLANTNFVSALKAGLAAMFGAASITDADVTINSVTIVVRRMLEEKLFMEKQQEPVRTTSKNSDTDTADQEDAFSLRLLTSNTTSNEPTLDVDYTVATTDAAEAASVVALVQNANAATVSSAFQTHVGAALVNAGIASDFQAKSASAVLSSSTPASSGGTAAVSSFATGKFGLAWSAFAIATLGTTMAAALA
ncbi:unnamed protein product [Amoebophrya sp. A120]|nr:unnamed protein product [Amoebophrya sp. A120]|eukprot:GSA120T00007137001.1